VESLEEELKNLKEELKGAEEDLSNFQELENQKYIHDNNTIAARYARQGAIADHARRIKKKSEPQTWETRQAEVMRGLSSRFGGKRKKTKKKSIKKENENIY
jgi:hypothetical protein